MRVACCQLDTIWEDKAANHAKVRAMLAAAKIPAGTLFVLPEMFSTGFSMNVDKIAEGKDRQTEKFLAQIAAEYKIFVMGGVVNVGPDGKGRNQSLCFSPDGKEIARYNKMQPFMLGSEGQHYTAGTEVLTFQCQDFLVAPFVCYDLRFPEIFRQAARKAPHLIVVIASWPIKRIHHWVALLKARAIENQCYVVGVNRCGNDPKYQHNGHSLILDYHGETLADAGEREGIVSAELDLPTLLEYRRELPFLQDMRHV